MQEDINLKELLLNSAIEKTSPDFTKNVMAGIEQLHASNAFSKSLINAKWKKVFQICFTIISLLVILLSFLIKPADLPAIDFKVLAFPIPDLYQVMVYIIAFWALVLLSMRMNKRDENMLS